MRRSRNQVDTYYNRDISLHKPGVVPNSSRIISPITANRHKYELNQRIWPKKTVESWFANHSSNERRAVYSFLDTLYQADGTNGKDERRQKSPVRRGNTATVRPLQRRLSSNDRQDSRTSKRDLGEVLETLESFRPSSSAQDKGVQATSTAFMVPLPDVNGAKNDRKSDTNSAHSPTSIVKHTETIPPNNTPDTNDKSSRRYLSHSWRVINPREDIEQNVRPDNNTSSFFNYTKKAYPEYFFIHPDWY